MTAVAVPTRGPGALTRLFSPALAIAGRHLRVVLTSPAGLLPPLIVPIVFFGAFSGALAVIARLPGFDYPDGYLSFEFVFIVLQGAAFSGIYTGLGLARDFEEGIAARMLTGIGNRRSIVLGYVLAALGRAPVATIVLSVLALACGMPVSGGVGGALGMFVLSECMAAVGALWATGMSLRLRSVQAAPLVQMPSFLAFYLAPAFAPLPLLAGWLHVAAVVNPFSFLIGAGRDLLAGRSGQVGPAVLITAALIVLLYLWAASGLRRATTVVAK
jgi:ABC-2 type transport system permease protein